MERIKAQGRKVSSLIFSASTGAVYKQMFALTWQIVRETALLLWLVVCLVFVAAEWFYRRSIALGRSTRRWSSNLGQVAASATEPRSLSTVGQSMLGAGQAGATFLVTQARRQLDMADPPTPAPSTPPAAAAPAPVSPATQGLKAGDATGTGSSGPGQARVGNPAPDVDA